MSPWLLFNIFFYKVLRQVNECLRKRSLDVRQAKRIVQDRSEWQGFVRENGWGIALGMNPRP